MHAACLLGWTSIRHMTCLHRQNDSPHVPLLKTDFSAEPSVLSAGCFQVGHSLHSSTSKFIVRPEVISVRLFHLSVQ